MMSVTSTLAVLLGLSAVAKAHFTLEVPAPIGPYSDVDLIKGPCDGYDPTTVTTFQDYPWRGQGWGLITTHPSVIWEFNAALFSTVTKSQSSFVPLAENAKQNTGTGFLCLGPVPGKKEWVGQKAIVQIIQHAPDGALTTCAAVTFTDGPPASGASNCFNNSGPANLPYDISWLPGTGSDNLVVSSSSSIASSMTTSSSGSSASSISLGSSATSSGPLSSSTGSTFKSAVLSGTTIASSATKTGNSSSHAGTSTTASGVTSSNSTATSASTSSPASFTGAAGKGNLGSLGLAGIILGGLMAFEM